MSRQKQILALFKQLDLFQKPVRLLIRREEGHRTVHGAFLSLMLIVIMLTFFFSNLQELADRTNPISLTTEVYHPSPGLFSLTPDNFTLQFSLQDPTFHTYIDESVYLIDAQLVTKVTVNENGKSRDEWRNQELPLMRCDQYEFRQASLKQYFLNFDLPTNFCIDWEKIPNNRIDLQGTFDSPIFKHLVFNFKLCTEQTRKANGPQCRKRDEIVQLLDHNYFSLQFSSNYIDLKNPNNPNIPKAENFYTTVSSKIFKEITFYFSPVTTRTDEGVLVNDEHIDQTIKYTRNTEIIDLNDSDTIASIVFRMDKIETVYYRSYQKLQSMLAELGGLWNVLFTFAMVMQLPFLEVSYQLAIINSLFNFENQNEQRRETASPFDNDAEQLDVRSSTKIFAAEMFRTETYRSDQNRLSLRADELAKLQNNSPTVKKSKFHRMDSIRSRSQREIKVLDEIRKHSHQLVNSPSNKNQEGGRQNSTQRLNELLKGFFQTVSRRLQIPFLAHLGFYFKVQSTDQKGKQLRFAVSRMEKSLDILYIIKKLHEIDKLKMILLTKSQIKLFDYLPKPTITVEAQGSEQYFSILRPVKSNYQTALEAQQAFKEISRHLEDPINLQLVNCMDENIVDLLQNHLNNEEQQMESNEGEQAEGGGGGGVFNEASSKGVRSEQ